MPQPRSQYARSFSHVVMLLLPLAWLAPQGFAQKTRVSQADAGQEAAAHNSPVASELQPEFQRFIERIDQQRKAAHVPAISIAIIRNGEIVLARGLGTANLEADTPATAETRYSIGSTTKHVNAALLAQLEDEGVLSLDDHPAAHIEGFALSDPDANSTVNLRDLLSHRTGLTRMSLLWYGNEATFSEILTALPKAELYRPFRTEFLYNNVMYACAGQAAANAAGQPWADLVTDRIFKPAGMSATTASFDAFVADPLRATGYRWDANDEAFVVMPPRNIEIVAPAGSVYSTVLDMAAWAQTLLSDGVAPSGSRVLAPGVFETIATEHIAMSESSAYGLGFFLDTWQGERVVQHGGNIDGYFSTFALMPERNAAVIALGNVTGSPLQESIITSAWEMLFPELAAIGINEQGQQEDRIGLGTDQTALDPDDLTGNYVLEGTPLSITITKASQTTDAQSESASDEDPENQPSLTLSLPGQPPYPLTPPRTAADSWTHTQGVIFSVRFLSSGGHVIGLQFNQGQTSALVPRVGHEAEFVAMQTRLAQQNAPFSADELARLEGDYLFELQGVNFTVSQLNGRLAVAIPGQIEYELEWPDAEGWWVFRMVPAARVRFHEADEDNPNPTEPPLSMELSQGPARFTLPRVDSRTESLPTAQALQARVRNALQSQQWTPDSNIQLRGTITFPNQGISGEAETLFAGLSDVVTHSVMKPFAVESLIIDINGGWSSSNLTGPIELDERQTESAMAIHPVFWARDWTTEFSSVEISPERTIRDVACYPVHLKTTAGAEIVLFVDVESALVRALDVVQDNPLVGSINVRTHLDDYQEVGGVLVPMRWSGEMLGNGSYEVLYQQADLLDARPAAPFDRTAR